MQTLDTLPDRAPRQTWGQILEPLAVLAGTSVAALGIAQLLQGNPLKLDAAGFLQAINDIREAAANRKASASITDVLAAYG
jgi:hypothetical protein